MLNTSNSLLNTIGNQTKKAAENTVRAATEETKIVADNTVNQISPAPLTEEQKKNTRQEVEGIYGGRDAMMDPSKFQNKFNEDQKRTAGLMEQILGELLGPSHKPKDNRKQQVASEHKHEAEQLGVVKQDQNQLEEQQNKRAEEQEEARKKEEKKAKLEQQIEAPAGKQTGMSFGRKKSAIKMLQKPASAETRGGKGNRE